MKRVLYMPVLLVCMAFTGCTRNCPECTCETSRSLCAAEEAAPVRADTTPVTVGGEAIALPKPIPLGTTLTKALETRRSVRSFADEMISAQDLSNLLWSANGINREEGKRTAPSSRNKQSVSIYVAFEKGAYLYDFKAHQLKRVSETDLRINGDSPIELIFVSNHVGNGDSPADRERAALVRGIDAGTASQNAALYCAAAGLGTVIRMYNKPKSEDAAALKLADGDHLLFVMNVGIEKK